MDLPVLSESVRRALHRVIAFTDPSAQPAETMRQLQSRYKQRREVATNEDIAKDLGLKSDEIERFFDERLDQAVDANTNFEGNFVAQSIALLRLLIWLEIALKTKDGVAPHLLPMLQPEVEAKKRLRAVELVLRALINERHPRQDELIEHLKHILKKDAKIEKWLKLAEPGDLLSGTVLLEVAKIFLHEEEWRAFGKIYVSAAGLTYLNDKRLTIWMFLEDINPMRNSVAHHKPLSDGQIELLDIYYGELVAPVQDLFRAGGTKVNPKSIIDVDSTVLERYFSTLQSELSVLDRRTERMERGLEEVGSNIKKADSQGRRINIKVSVILASLLLAASAIAYGVLSARSAVLLDFRSLGWVTLSGESENNESPMNVQARFWMGNEQSRFADATLVAVAQRPTDPSVTVDLTKKLDPNQVGSEEAIEFSLAPSTSRLVTCLSIPSSRLNGRFRVTQRFLISRRGSEINFSSTGQNVVAKDDGSPCG